MAQLSKVFVVVGVVLLSKCRVTRVLHGTIVRSYSSQSGTLSTNGLVSSDVCSFCTLDQSGELSVTICRQEKEVESLK